MCDALMELFKEEFEQREGVLLQQGIEQGIEQGVALGVAESRKEMIGNALNRGNTPETIADFMGIPLAEVEAIEKQLKSE